MKYLVHQHSLFHNHIKLIIFIKNNLNSLINSLQTNLHLAHGWLNMETKASDECWFWQQNQCTSSNCISWWTYMVHSRLIGCLGQPSLLVGGLCGHIINVQVTYSQNIQYIHLCLSPRYTQLATWSQFETLNMKHLVVVAPTVPTNNLFLDIVWYLTLLHLCL